MVILFQGPNEVVEKVDSMEEGTHMEEKQEATASLEWEKEEQEEQDEQEEQEEQDDFVSPLEKRSNILAVPEGRRQRKRSQVALEAEEGEGKREKEREVVGKNNLGGGTENKEGKENEQCGRCEKKKMSEQCERCD